MKRRHILEQYLQTVKSSTDSELEAFMQALFAKDEEDNFVTNNLRHTIELSDTMPIF